MDRLKISIIIPIYNQKYLLKETLDSLFNQECSKDRYEVVVVDDGSTDGTEEMINKLMDT